MTDCSADGTVELDNFHSQRLTSVLWVQSALPRTLLPISYLFSDVPITIITDPPVVLVGEQVTLHCWLADSVPSNMSVLWYKKEERKNNTLCFSPSLGGMVEQCQNEEWCRTEGRWERRALLLIIRQVRVADEGAYVCAVRGDVGSQEAITHLDVIKMGNKPTFQRHQLEENMCCYTCKSKGWYPKPEVHWRSYGRKTINVEAKTNVTWNEGDLFTVQSNITVPCDNVDVTCAVILPKANKSRTGAMNEMILHKPNTCTYTSRIRGSYVKPKIMWINHEGEDLSSLAQTHILQEDNIFAMESSIEIPCGQPPTAFMITDREFGLHLLAQKSEKHKKEIEKLQKENGEFFWLHEGCVWQLRLIFCTPQNAKLLIRELRQFETWSVADDVKVDGDTAHPNLTISEDRKSFRHNSHAQKVTQNEGRFDSAVCVLASEGFSSGKHYWEVEVEKSNDWDLGVARKSIQRKGIISLSVKEGFWALGSSLKDYWARTDPWMRVVVQKKPKKIGIYLSYEEKYLIFFNVTDMSVIFMFKDCAFSEEVYPFFKNSQKESTMRICSIKEE
ncbi:butyrophilin subfamily 1 member A1-like [Rhea pennata]|uniref:butyrophilin subfamily 1 member A1-like n=1 Tax=Rhea pennata TaxID=8795 RepID=UPI002E261900